MTKGLATNIQNIAIKNAGLLGKSLKNQNVLEEIRKKAIIEYLNQSGALFFNRQYIKKIQKKSTEWQMVLLEIVLTI